LPDSTAVEREIDFKESVIPIALKLKVQLLALWTAVNVVTKRTRRVCKDDYTEQYPEQYPFDIVSSIFT